MWSIAQGMSSAAHFEPLMLFLSPVRQRIPFHALANHSFCKRTSGTNNSPHCSAASEAMTGWSSHTTQSRFPHPHQPFSLEHTSEKKFSHLSLSSPVLFSWGNQGSFPYLPFYSYMSHTHPALVCVCRIISWLWNKTTHKKKKKSTGSNRHIQNASPNEDRIHILLKSK